MTLLLLSIIALLMGPLISAISERRPLATDFLDAFVLAAIGGLAALHILPFCWSHAGWFALLAIGAGLLLPLLLRMVNAAAKNAARLSPVTSLLALGALALHSFLDGVALMESIREESRMLALAVVLHRFPIGLGIWRLAGGVYGRVSAGAAVSVIILATLFGYRFGSGLGLQGNEFTLALFQAFMAGSLIHLFRHSPILGGEPAVSRRRARLLGVLAALAALAYLSLQEQAFLHA